MLRDLADNVKRSSLVRKEEERTQLSAELLSIADDLNTAEVDAFVPDHAAFIVDDLAQISRRITDLIKKTEELGSLRFDKYFEGTRSFTVHLTSIQQSVKFLRDHISKMALDARKLKNIVNVYQPTRPAYSTTFPKRA